MSKCVADGTKQQSSTKTSPVFEKREALLTRIPSGSRVYRDSQRQILPKPGVLVKREKPIHSKPAKLPTIQRQCRVPVCRIPICQLRSHHNYLLLSQHGKSKALNSNATSSHSNSHYQSKKHHTFFDLTIINGGVDGMPSLPLDGLQVPVLRELFHIFFSYEYDRILTIQTPPPVSAMQKRLADEAKQEALATALSDPILCLRCITAAHFPIKFRTSFNQPDSTTVVLQAKMLSLLRKRLKRPQVYEDRDVVVNILGIVMVEISTGCMDSLPMHRKAMERLVQTQGGLHNMGSSLPFITTLDRLLCIFTNLPLCFPPPSDIHVRRPFPYDHVYGAFFESQTCAEYIDTPVIKYCFDGCRVIELLDRQGWTFKPSDDPKGNASDLHYTYYLKNCLLNDFARLNVQLANRDDLSRCILLTAKIVDYVVTQDNYIIVVPFHLANTLQAIITKHTIDFSSPPAKAALRWILFVLSSLPVPWHAQQWSLDILRDQLETEYSNTPWPQDWRTTELANVRAFIWSDTYFSPSWNATCDELENSRITKI